MTLDRNISVLIVDDFPAMLRIMKNLLNSFALQNVDEAHDGEQALAMLRRKPYGLVLSDWNMQPVSGLELLAEVRRDEALKHTPFILVTAENKADERAKAEAAGVSGYLAKPFTAETLKAEISRVLGPL